MSDELTLPMVSSMAGMLGPDQRFNLIISGDLTPKKLGKLIALLQAQKAVLEEEDIPAVGISRESTAVQTTSEYVASG